LASKPNRLNLNLVEQPTTAEESAEKVTPQAEKVTAEVEVKLVYETDVGPRIKAIGAYKREERRWLCLVKLRCEGWQGTATVGVC
jgi:hypothetical protein